MRDKLNKKICSALIPSYYDDRGVGQSVQGAFQGSGDFEGEVLADRALRRERKRSMAQIKTEIEWYKKEFSSACVRGLERREDFCEGKIRELEKELYDK